MWMLHACRLLSLLRQITCMHTSSSSTCPSHHSCNIMTVYIMWNWIFTVTTLSLKLDLYRKCIWTFLLHAGLLISFRSIADVAVGKRNTTNSWTKALFFSCTTSGKSAKFARNPVMQNLQNLCNLVLSACICYKWAHAQPNSYSISHLLDTVTV